MKCYFILSSALLFSCALIQPDWFFWCVLVYLIPLFYAAQRYKVMYMDGIIWAIVMYSVHWYEVGVFAITYGNGIARYFVVPFLVGYCAAIAGLWVHGASRWSAWIISTWLYIIYMQRYAFFIFGRVQGYPFTFPFVPLAAHTSLMQATRLIHPHLLLLSLVAGSWFLSRLLIEKKGKPALLSALCYTPFLLGTLCPRYQQEHELMDAFGYISPQSLSPNMLERAGEIAHAANKLARTHPTVSYILTPESTMPISLNNYPEIMDVFYQNLDDDITLFLGTLRNEENKLFNCCYSITSCLIIQGYDKYLLMPFTEYVPNIWLNFDCFNRLFLLNEKKMNWNRKKEVFHSTVSPAICSDFYLDWFDKRNYEEKPLLLLVKEIWFPHHGLKRLMMLAARYGALARRQHIIYVGHEKGIWIYPNGSEKKLLGNVIDHL